MLWQLLLVAVALWAVYFRWQRRRIRKVYEEIPCAELRGLPVIGHMHLFGGSHEDMMNFYKKCGAICNKQGGMFSLWMGFRLYLNVTDPVVIDLIAKSCLEKDYNFTSPMRKFTGNGTAFATVPFWRPRRKTMAPTFNLRNMHYFVNTFAEQSAIMVERLSHMAGKGDLSLWKYLTSFSFDSICENSMGIQIKTQTNPNHPFLAALDRVLKLIAQRIATPWLYADVIYNALPMYKEFEKNKHEIYNFIDQIIKAKRDELAQNDNELSDKHGKRTFLDMCMPSSGGEKGYNNLEMREEIVVMLLAGTDTSAVGSAYASVLLSRYPDIQEKVYKEIQDVLGDLDRPLNIKDLNNLKYMDAVIKETLRLYPPVPVVAREIENDITLPSGTVLVNGVSVIFNIWGTHRNPKYWGEDAAEFRPERFLEHPLQHSGQFIPFSVSFRNCVGYSYAMLSMKTAIATLLRSYQILPPKDLDPSQWKEPLRVKFDIMMKPVEDYVVRLEHRNK